MFQIHGDGLSRSNLQNLFVVSGIEALPSTRLYEAYFEKQWGAKKVSLKLGQFAADSEFFNTKYTDVLTNASMGWPAITSPAFRAWRNLRRCMSQPFGSIEVEKGTVIHAAGENPTDVQARWLGVTQEMGIDPDTMDVHFINGVVKISENVANIEAEVATKKLQPTLVIVDTVAAYFEGDDDNDNVQMGNYARLLRSMTNLPGGPCVLALAHPTKRAADDDLIPKGGGAFLNEVDGNVALRRNGQVIAFEALGKFRGPSFEPVHFELVTVQHPKLRDTKGRAIPTVVARPVSDFGIVERERANERDEDTLLRAIDQHPAKAAATWRSCSE
ncbi:carbohydrate porin [Bradyrhizobium sp. 613_E4_N2_2]|jgi:hypothetical protein|uniref:carbohydrate porin n=1 Tax=Bradyrhizobium sp. 613_E4_N2_2 TaxID=3240371 RepID=UPI003F8B644F